MPIQLFKTPGPGSDISKPDPDPDPDLNKCFGVTFIRIFFGWTLLFIYKAGLISKKLNVMDLNYLFYTQFNWLRSGSGLGSGPRPSDLDSQH
jgi:hypothetical protein